MIYVKEQQNYWNNFLGQCARSCRHFL